MKRQLKEELNSVKILGHACALLFEDRHRKLTSWLVMVLSLGGYTVAVSGEMQ